MTSLSIEAASHLGSDQVREQENFKPSGRKKASGYFAANEKTK